MQIFLNFCAPCDKRAQCVRAWGEGECFVLGGCCYENIWEILNLNDPRVRGAAVWGGGGAARGGGLTGKVHSINSYCAYLSLIWFSH